MQPPACTAQLGRAHDEVGHLLQVAQFQQVARNVDADVEMTGFLDRALSDIDGWKA